MKLLYGVLFLNPLKTSYLLGLSVNAEIFNFEFEFDGLLFLFLRKFLLAFVKRLGDL